MSTMVCEMHRTQVRCQRLKISEKGLVMAVEGGGGGCVRSLQIGISWAVHVAGGSCRVFADLIKHLPENGIEVTGIVSAPTDVSALTHGQIDAFAPENAS